MNKNILSRIEALGGNISAVSGKSLALDIAAVTFDTVLYAKREDAPWTTKEEEPIYGLAEYVEKNKSIFESDSSIFYKQLIQDYYCLTKEPKGQVFWVGREFTPFRKGTSDYEEFYDDFINDDYTDFSVINEVVGTTKPNMIQLFYSYGFPDHYYICLEDPQQDNPTVFSTDHSSFFMEITNEGRLEDFLKQFITADELINIIEKALNKK